MTARLATARLSGRAGRRRAQRAPRALRRRGVCAADRLRERGQFAAGARSGGGASWPCGQRLGAVAGASGRSCSPKVWCSRRRRVLGLIMAYWGVDSCSPSRPNRFRGFRRRSRSARRRFLDRVSLAVGVLFGLAPAFQSGARRGRRRAQRRRTHGHSAFAAAAACSLRGVALSLVLLIGAGLMLTSFSRLRAVDPGFAVQILVFVGVPLPQARYDGAAQARFYTAALRARDA